MREDKEKSEYAGYPVGILGSGNRIVHIWFMHGYKNFSQAKAKWEERASRIHWDNLYFIMTDREGSTEELAHKFDALPYRHKALMTYRDSELYPLIEAGAS